MTDNYCYVSPCINERVEGDYYCEHHVTNDSATCPCKGCVREAAKVWDRTKPHCREEARSAKVFVTQLDTGGHMQCLEELNADGTCPNAHNHHVVWVDANIL